MRFLKQSVAATVTVGPAVVGTTGGTLVSPTTGLTAATVDEIGVYKAGGTSLVSSSGSTTFVHRAGGKYTLTFTTGMVDTLGPLNFYLRDDSACLPVDHEFMVLPANAYDSLVAGSDKLAVDLDQIGGSSQSQIDLKDFADAGYDPATNKVQGVVLVDTVTTNTDMRGTDSAFLAASAPTNFGSMSITTGGIASADAVALAGSSGASVLAAALYDNIHSGAVVAAAAGTVTLSTGATNTANYYQGSVAVIYSGPGAGQSPRSILSGTTARVQTISPNWTTTPTTASLVAVLPAPPGVSATTGLPSVNVTALGGSSQSQADLKDFADAGYDPATNKVQGVVLADTVTTLTGHTVQTGDSFARIGAAGAGLTGLGGMSTGMMAQVQTEANDALVANNLDHLALTGTTVTVIAGTYLGRIMHSSTAATYDRTTDSLEAVRNRGDAAWSGGSTAVNPANFSALVISTDGIVNTDLQRIRSSSQSAIDLQDFADSGYDPATNKVQGVVLVDTVTTNTDMRGTDSAFLAASAPTNFGSLSISTAGAIGTVTTNTDMRGTDSAFLAASAPTNFSSLAITTGGHMTVGSTGLNPVVLSQTTGVPVWGTVTVPQALAYSIAPTVNKVIQNSTEWTLRNQADGADLATRPVTATTATVTMGTVV